MRRSIVCGGRVTVPVARATAIHRDMEDDDESLAQLHSFDFLNLSQFSKWAFRFPVRQSDLFYLFLQKIKKATRIIRSRTGMRAGKLIIWGRQKWPPVYSNGRPQHVLQGTTWFPRYSGWRLWGTFASKGRWHRLGSRLHGLASSKSTTWVDYKNE